MLMQPVEESAKLHVCRSFPSIAGGGLCVYGTSVSSIRKSILEDEAGPTTENVKTCSFVPDIYVTHSICTTCKPAMASRLHQGEIHPAFKNVKVQLWYTSPRHAPWFEWRDPARLFAASSQPSLCTCVGATNINM